MNPHAVIDSVPRHPWRILPLVVVLMVALVGSPALGAEHKRFTLHIADDTAAPGILDSFSATLVNHSPQQQLGSANITVPAQFALAAVVHPPTVNGSSKGSATKNGNVIQLRNLAAPPNGVVVVEFTATTPCAAGTYDFDAIAKQSNNFSGPPGNDLTLDRAASALSVTVTSGCAVALRFVEGRQPAHAEKDANITSAAFNPAGDPIQVEVVDADGQRVSSATNEISVGIGTNPSGGTLSGTTTRNALDGVAAFDDLAIDVAGVGYTLTATSGQLVPATSDPFNIYDDACLERETCVATAGTLDGDGIQSSASGTAGPGAGGLIVTLGDAGLDCPGTHSRLPATTTLIGDNLTSKQVTFRVSKAADQLQPNNGVAHYQVCAEPLDAESEFTDRQGNHIAVGQAGLLPDCGSPGPAVPPCVQSKTKTGDGDVVISVLWGSQFKMR